MLLPGVAAAAGSLTRSREPVELRLFSTRTDGEVVFCTPPFALGMVFVYAAEHVDFYV